MAASDDQVQKKIQVSKLTYLAMLGLAALVLIKIKHLLSTFTSRWSGAKNMMCFF